MKFETQHFHMFANNNWDRNLWIGAPLSPGGPSPSTSKKSNSSLIGRFWWNLKHNIFICSPIIIEIEIYDKGPPSLLKKVKFFIYWPILMKFETQHFHMFTTNNWDKNVWIGAPLPPSSKKTDSSFIVQFLLNLKHNIFKRLPIIITIEIYGFYFWRRKGGGAKWPPFINLNLNYYWWTYENVVFQISAKSHQKWRIWLLEVKFSFIHKFLS